jgi:hypothetical protein
MGQLIRPQAAPMPCSILEPAASVGLISIRWWVSDRRAGTDPLPRLRQGMEAAGSPDAASSIDTFMAAVLASARRPITVERPRFPTLSSDERDLLTATALAQHGDTALAEKVLCKVLLSADGAAFALGPLEGLGRLLAQARLFFRQRWQPDFIRPTIH